MMPCRRGKSPKRPSSLRSVAATRPRWPTLPRVETVRLDLGSGGGIDVLLSARRVGPTGKAYGLDMTDEMLALARENQRKAGVENVEFLKGEIENIPLPDNSVDVIISNCVFNLSGDKEKRSARRAFRVLSNRAAGSLSPTWLSAATCPSKFAAAWKCGSVALPVRCMITNTSANSPRPGSTPSTSSRPAFIASRTHGGFSPAKVSTSMRWPRWWKTNS